MKKWIVFISILLFFSFFQVMPVSAKEKVNVYLFYGEGCPHCAAEEDFIKSIQPDYPDLNFVYYETWFNKENAKLMDKVKAQLNVANKGVPFTVVGDQYLSGFADYMKEDFLLLFQKMVKNPPQDVVAAIQKGEEITGKPSEPLNKEEVTVPILGKINAKSVSLPIIAIILGFIDGINPCAMWVLLFLLSMLIGTHNRKRMWGLGLTFLISSAFIYFLFMMAWINIAVSMTEIIWVRDIIAFLAIVFGAWSLSRYFIPKEAGCDIVPDGKRKKVFENIKRYVTKKSFFLALIGIVILAFSVNLVELACSAGLPLLFSSILALNELNQFQYIAYVALYVFFFLIDDLIIFAVTMATLKLKGVSTRITKYSHLIGGIIMLILGILLILKPGWLMFQFG